MPSYAASDLGIKSSLLQAFNLESNAYFPKLDSLWAVEIKHTQRLVKIGWLVALVKSYRAHSLP